MKKWTYLPYQKKLKFLGWAILPVLLICYKLAFARTIAEYRLYKQHSTVTEEMSTANGAANKLQAKNKQLDTLLHQYTLDTLHQNRNLLEIVSEFCHDYPLRLKDYKPLPVFKADSMTVLTRTLTVEGEFINCLYLVYALEQQYQAGRVSSVHYKTYEEPTDHTKQLLCTIYVQNILQ